MKVTLPNGLVIEGTPSQIEDACRKFGYNMRSVMPSDLYYSESRGEWVEIRVMNTIHIRNALLKIYKAWVDELHVEKDPQKLYNKIITGPTDMTLVNLLKELGKRRE